MDVTFTDDTMPAPARVESLLDAELFEGWLADWAPSAVVGFARSDARCPLARFLSELVGSQVDVGTQRAYIDEGASGHVSLPEWAERFVALVDGTTPQMPPAPITASEARRYLEAALSDGA